MSLLSYSILGVGDEFGGDAKRGGRGLGDIRLALGARKWGKGKSRRMMNGASVSLICDG